MTGVSGYFDREQAERNRRRDAAERVDRIAHLGRGLDALVSSVRFRDTDPRPRGLDALVPTEDLVTPGITRREQAMFKRAADRAALVDLMLKADTILADAPDAVDQAGTLADAILDRGLYLRG